MYRSRRKNTSQPLSFNGNKTSNLQERLYRIRQGETEKLSITEFKKLTKSENQKEMVGSNKDSPQTKCTFVASLDLSLKNLPIKKRFSLSTSKLEFKNEEPEEFKFSNNFTKNVTCHSTEYSTTNLISNVLNKKINIGLNDSVAGVQNDLVTEELNTNRKLNEICDNFKKLVIQENESNENKLEQDKFAGDCVVTNLPLYQNITPPSLLQGKKKVMQERLFSIKYFNTSTDLKITDKKAVITKSVNKNDSVTPQVTPIPLDNTFSHKNPLDFNKSPDVIKNNQIRMLSYNTRMKNLKAFVLEDNSTLVKPSKGLLNGQESNSNNLSFNKSLDVIKNEQNRIVSYNTRLKNLKSFVFKNNANSIKLPNEFFNEQIDCFPAIYNRKILKAKRTIQQTRPLSTSCDESSGVNNKLLKSNEINENNHLSVKIIGEELPSLDCTKDINLNNVSTNKLNQSQSKEVCTNIKTNASNVKNEPVECKHIKVENYSEIQHMHEKFSFPKNILHNFYNLLSNQTKDKSLKVDPYYKLIKSKQITEWVCMYHLKWPENCKVSAQALTKKRASSFAALKCLAVLSEYGKISPDGLPLIHTREEVKELTQTKQTELKFDDDTIKKMQHIVDIFSNKMSHFTNGMEYNKYDNQGNEIFDEEDSANDFLSKTPKYLGMHHYLSKEKVVLPIARFKDSFIQLIQNNNCVIVKGEPGCGKSSRVPQYVLEAWVKEATSEDQLCRIAVTQPRRIAAISLAERVASERDEQLGLIVGYQVRLKSNFQPTTGRILYCTTGVLLRYLQSDPNLTKFSHVILDEAHERDVNTDLLMNLMKRALEDNNNLKVVVMSATIDADKFSKYFGGAPVFDVPGFTYPVTKHFLDDCKMDISKTLKISNGETPQVIHEDIAQVLGYIHKNKPEGAILTFLPGWDDLVKVSKRIPTTEDVVVHLVHSKLKDSEQHKIFSKPPPGVRKIILATNIAETSITIDDVVYVVDAGIHKENIFDNDKGINVIDMDWISKASANQRAGRAGRCSPGESFHLYTQERFSKFPDYSSPKILNSSLTKVVLDSKTFSNNMDACDFMNGLITPPEKVAVERAVNELKQLELLDENEKLTPLGRTLANFQLEPTLAKVMVNAVVFKCVTPIVDIVTLFSSDAGIFGSSGLTDKEGIKHVKSQFCKSSDHLALMRVFEKWSEFCEENPYAMLKFCRETKLVPYKLEFIQKLKEIHFRYLYNGLYDSVPLSEDFSDNDELVKAILYSGTGTVLKHRNWDIVKNRLKTNVNVLVTRNNQKATITAESVNYKRHKFPSNFLVYINETRSNIKRTTIVRECSLIPTISVLLFSKDLEILEADSKNDNLSENMVIISIKNTKLQFLCDKSQAEILLNCKKAIDASYKYLIHQLTYAGEEIPEFLKHWDNILSNLGDILEKTKME